MMGIRSVEGLFPPPVAYVRGLGLPRVHEPFERRVAVRLPKGRTAIMSAADCCWTTLDAVYRPSSRSSIPWRTVRQVPLSALPICSKIAENDKQPASAVDALDVLDGVSARSVVYVGGSQSRRSLVIADLASGDAVSGVTRVGYDAVSNYQVERETRQLRALDGMHISGVRWPAVTRFTSRGGICACSSTAPEGSPGDLDTPTVEQMHGAHTRIVAQTSHIRSAGELLEDAVPGDLGKEILDGMPLGWAETEIPCAVVHGDFAPWNARMAGDDVFLFDWTNSTVSGPAFYDRLFLAHQLHRLISRGNADSCSAMLRQLARAQYPDLESDLVVRVYLLLRLADAVLNDSRSDIAEVAAVWQRFRGGTGHA